MKRTNGSIFLRGNVWWIKFYRDGKAVSMSCKGMTEAQAGLKLKAELRKSDEEFLAPRERRVTITELMENLFLHYEVHGKDKARKDAKAMWENHMKSFFGNMKACLLETKHQLEYRKKRAGEGAENATINRDLQCLRRAFKIGEQHKPPLVKKCPRFVITSEKNNIRKGFVNITQIDALEQAAAEEGLEWLVLLKLGYKLGWRKGEYLERLTVGHVRIAERVIRLEPGETKNGRGREVPLTDSLMTLLTPMVLGRDAKAPLFQKVTYAGLRYGWLRITKKAGIPTRITKRGKEVSTLLFHDLRRTSARAKRGAGTDASVIMAMSGWETDSVFRRYAIVENEDKLDAMKRQELYEAKQREEAALLAKQQTAAVEAARAEMRKQMALVS